MNVPFCKYHGAGNDFIILDNRELGLKLKAGQIARLCDRRLGIGADGLMYVEASDIGDFEMVYFNADGYLGTMCGNGGRCIADFACKMLHLASRQIRFKASDGMHHADILADNQVSLSMNKVNTISFGNGFQILDTGSPHYICQVEKLETFPVVEKGRAIRNQPAFGPRGINVNFVENKEGVLCLRTYERGVENETFACGTGVTAAAIASVGAQTGTFNLPIKTKGGYLFSVSFTKKDAGTAEDILLTGPVCFVFKGLINIENLD